MTKLESVLLLFLLAGCSKPAPQPTPEPPPPAPIPEPQPPVPPEPVPDVACKATENRSLVRARKVSPRIVGGHESMPGAYPWMVAIGYKTGTGTFNYCGGTLIASNWVLTAAHCQVLPGDVVTIGRHDMTTTEGVQVSVKRALTHAEYNPATNQNDISVVELDRYLVSPHTVTLGEAPQQGTAKALGWGLTSEGGTPSVVLKEVDVPITPNDKCNTMYGGGITPDMMCADDGEGASCQGDSGGALLYEGKQAGITSFGIGCARPEFPGVYQRTWPHRAWIEACIVEE